MSTRTTLECPNCGSSDFVDLGGKTRCVYCGTVIEQQTPPTRPVVRCLRCGFDNDPGNLRCSKCGAALSVQSQPNKKNITPATASILVTVLGSMFIWIAGPIVGLVLGYKALSEARVSGSLAEEKQARTAVIIGWVFIAFNLLIVCLMFATSWVQAGIGVCGSLAGELTNDLPEVFKLLR